MNQIFIVRKSSDTWTTTDLTHHKTMAGAIAHAEKCVALYKEDGKIYTKTGEGRWVCGDRMLIVIAYGLYE